MVRTERGEVTDSPDYRHYRSCAYRLFYVVDHVSPDEFAHSFYMTAASLEWENIADHCAAAGVYAGILCDLVGIEDMEKRKVIRAAINHDAGKVAEILGFRLNPDPSPEELELLMNLNAGRLKELGTDEEVMRLAESCIPKTVFGPETLPGQVVWYVDAMLNGVEPMPIRRRMEAALAASINVTRSARNRAIHGIRVEGVSLHQLQIEIGHNLSSKFVEMFGGLAELQIEDVEDLPIRLGRLFEERVANYDPELAFCEYQRTVWGEEKGQTLAAGEIDEVGLPNFLDKTRSYVLVCLLMDQYSRRTQAGSLLPGMVVR